MAAQTPTVAHISGRPTAAVIFIAVMLPACALADYDPPPHPLFDADTKKMYTDTDFDNAMTVK